MESHGHANLLLREQPPPTPTGTRWWNCYYLVRTSLSSGSFSKNSTRSNKLCEYLAEEKTRRGSHKRGKAEDFKGNHGWILLFDTQVKPLFFC